MPLKAFLLARKELWSELFWSVFGQLISLFSGFLIVKVLTNQLSPTTYGNYALWMTLISLGNQVYFSAIASGLARFYSIARANNMLETYFQSVAYFFSKIMRFTAIVSLAILTFILIAPSKVGLNLLLASLLTSLSGFVAILHSINNAARNRRFITVSFIIDNGIKLALIIGAFNLLSYSNTPQILLIMIFAAAISLMYLSNRIGSNKDYLFSFNISYKPRWVKDVNYFARPLLISGIFNWSFFASQRWALEFSNGSAEVGKFFALSQLTYLPMTLFFGFLVSFLSPIVFQKANDLSNITAVKKSLRLLDFLVIFIFAFTIIACWLTGLFGDKYLSLFLPSSYYQSPLNAVILVMSAGVLYASIASGQVLSVLNQPNMILSLSTGGQLIFVTMNFAASFTWGLQGLIYSVLISSIVHLLWMRIIAFRAVRRYQACL